MTVSPSPVFSNAPASLLRVENLSIAFAAEGQKSQPCKVVENVSFTVEPGQTVAVVGESGSGKTVMALSLLQLLPNETIVQGQAYFNNQSLLDALPAHLKALRGRRIAFIFQEPMTSLNPLHTVEKQLKESLMLAGQKSSLASVIQLLTQVHLKNPAQKARCYPHQLSGGERQRVMIAMALAGKPDILIADEPTTALDITTQMEILTLLRALQKTLSMALILITHDLSIVRQMAEKVLVIEKGHLVEQGACIDVFTHPQHPYTQKLLAALLPDQYQTSLESERVVLEAKELGVCFVHSSGFLRRVTQTRTAVHPLNLTLMPGETLGIVGESGSGKTSLALALLALIPAEGHSLFEGISLQQMTAAQLRACRAQLQIVFQDPFASLNPRRTIEQSVGEGLDVHQPQLDRAQRQVLIHQALEEVGLDPSVQNRYPHAFSGGQRQRIAIARAMILKPRVLILDEPTSALDQSIQQDILSLLKTLQRTHQTSYIFISHDLRVIRALSHRVLVMQEGHVVEQGTTVDVFNHPQHAYTRLLLAGTFGSPSLTPENLEIAIR